MMNHYRTRPLRTALLVYAAVIAVLVTAGAARAIVQAMPMLLVAGLIVAAAIAAGRMTGRSAHRGSASLRAEIAALQVEAEQLRHDLAHARESAERAWDAAASQPPRPRPEPDDTARVLIGQPFSGVHPLTAEDGWQ